MEGCPQYSAHYSHQEWNPIKDKGGVLVVMFERKMSTMDWMALTAISVALTVPFVFILKDMSDSLQIIAEKK